jgi:hypothetical protein
MRSARTNLSLIQKVNSTPTIIGASFGSALELRTL